jgi:hypothetical protein
MFSLPRDQCVSLAKVDLPANPKLRVCDPIASGKYQVCPKIRNTVGSQAQDRRRALKLADALVEPSASAF